jgi:RNA polymerase sigma-70 factor (ECF subfamily)
VGRRRKREAARRGEIDDVDASPSSSPSPEDALGHKEELAVLQRLLAEMDDERREVFVLYEIEGLTGQEIAKHLGIPIGTVSSRLRRAREDFVAMVARMRAASVRRGSGR